MKASQEHPLVSIQCMVYNHEPYLRQCLDGFVMQRTNFKFEAIVHDDVSTDGSAAIIREYAEKYPDIIKPIYETENQYSKKDGSLDRIMREACNGKYIAICEGDDYWIDPLKLQKQVDFMEANPEYALCHTGFKIYNDDEGILVDCDDIIKRNSEQYHSNQDIMERILDGTYYRIQTVTTLFRMSSYSKVNNLLKSFEGKFLMGDTQLWISLLSVGNIFFLPEITSVYRIHAGSSCRPVSFQSKIHFDLSCAEMRVVMADVFNLSNKLKRKLQSQYQKKLNLYLTYVPNYKLIVQIKYNNFFECIRFNILRLPIIRNLLLYIYSRKNRHNEL